MHAKVALNEGETTMRIIALLLVAFVALSHVGFLVLEMFFWNRSGRPSKSSVRHRNSPRRRRCWRPTRASTTASSPPACCGGSSAAGAT